MAAGVPTLREVESLLKDSSNRRSLGVQGCPSDTCLDRTIRMIAPGELLPIIAKQIRTAHRSKQLPIDPSLGISLVAIDGKVLKTGKTQFHPEAQAQGTNGEGPPYVLRVLRAMLTSTEIKPQIGQWLVPAATNEMGVFRPFMESLFQEYGRTNLIECVTVDAGFTHKEDLEWLNQKGVGFIASLKSNQPKLLEGLQLFLGSGEAEPPEGWEGVFETVDPGRRVTRYFARTPKINTWHPEWGFLRGGWRIRQRVEHGGKVTWEDRYYVTNLPWNRLNAARAVKAVVSHWGIENCGNWTLDVHWGEDQGAWIQSETGIEVCAVLRILAYNLIRTLRHRVLRSSARNPLPYRRLFDLIRMAILFPIMDDAFT